jgi:tetratricopeptide (TPR) repeat protein
MLQKALIILIALTLIFTLGGWTVGTARADQCTAQQGQLLIDAGQYEQAIQEFTCVINAQPTEVEGYRGRIEARLLLGQYSEALRDFTLITVHVLPEQADAQNIILAGYSARLAVAPNNIPALTGQSFMLWADFNYAAAIQTLTHLVQIQPDNIYGNLFLGSSRLLKGAAKAKGITNLEYAIQLAPNSPDVHFIVADAYTYGLPDPQRAFAEANLALNGGLDTPRVHAILASSYLAFGDMSSAAEHIKTHIDLVTTEFVTTNPMDSNTTDTLELVPGRTYSIPIKATAGETFSVTTSSSDYWDTILVLLGPDGTPVAGADDDWFYFAELDWVAEQTATYLLQVTFFESVNSGEVVVTRD